MNPRLQMTLERYYTFSDNNNSKYIAIAEMSVFIQTHETYLLGEYDTNRYMKHI